MAKRRRKKRVTKTTPLASNRIVGLFFVLLSLLGIFHLGYVGILIANLFRIFIGDIYQIGWGIVLVFGIYMLLFSEPLKVSRRIWVGIITLALGVLLGIDAYWFSSLDLHQDFISINWQYISSQILSASVRTTVGGGMIGACLYTITHFLVSQIGSYIIAVILIILGLCYLADIEPRKVVDVLGKTLLYIVRLLTRFFRYVLPKIKSFISNHKEKLIQKDTSHSTIQEIDKESSYEEPGVDTFENEEDVTLNQTNTWDEPSVEEEQQADNQSFNMQFDTPSSYDYELPSLSLLSDVAHFDQSDEKKAINRNKKILVDTLKSFGVDTELKNVILGPSVTKYELHPAIGVKVSKIVNLSDDLALALAAKDLRIEAPIPGKSLIGIEVPNKNVATISFKDVVQTLQQQHHEVLEVPLGRDVSGKLVTCDLAKMPHLLIAGSTGSGKSVAINGIITSLLMNTHPDQVKMLLVDPKKVELGVYNGIPHLMAPVVTNPKKAAASLNKLVQEMERRYELFANTGQRNIKGYNEMISSHMKDTGVDEQPLPYIVAIVDELSDLMMTASNEVESAIIRLAQMARAAGIHMIIATQRPSVDVITGLIKANIPSRMAFAVSSGTDSRTIIDQNGAEKLLGRGDMLFLPMGTSKPVRVQGAYISDTDVENVVSYVSSQASANYDENMEVSDEELMSATTTNDDEDELFEQVVDFIITEQKVSISLLQRRFKIGYNRAARIVDDLEQRGMIGKQEGSKPRKVFLQKQDISGGKD